MKKIANLRIFPTILAGMIVGISFIILTDLWLPAVCVVTAVVVAAAGIAVARKKDGKALRAAALFCLCFAAGMIAGAGSALYANASLAEREVFVSGAEITAKIETGNSSDLSGVTDSYYVVLTDIVVNGEKLEGKAECGSVQFEGGEFSEGDVITFVGDVRTLSGVVTTPYKAYSLAEGTIYVIECGDDEDHAIRKTGEDLDLIDRIKKTVAKTLAENVEDDTARFMYAMTFGDSAVISDELKDGFSYTGTAHLLAVSGLHVGMIAGALFLLLKKLKAKAWVRFAVVTGALLFFCALCGFSPSAVRATVMVATATAAGMFGLRYDPLSGMSFAAIVLLSVSPYNLYSLGFLMSFIAVYGLILFAKPLSAAIRRAKFPGWLAAALSATLSANATLLPVMIYVFGDVSLVTVLANCVTVPVAGIFFPIYIVALPFAAIPHLGFTATVVSLPFTVMVKTVQALSEVNFPAVYFDFTWETIVLWLVAATAVSGLCTIPVSAKKIIASVLIICFVVSVIVQNAEMLGTDNKVVCFGSDACAGVLVEERGESDYLVFVGELDDETLTEAKEAMRKCRLRSVDFVVKYTFTQEEADLLDKYTDAFGTVKVYTEYTPSVAVEAENSYALAAVVSVISFADRAEIYLGGTDVLVAASERGLASAVGYGIVVCPAAESAPEGAYLVSDRGYKAGNENCLPSDFTFWTEDDRIVKTNKWRFA